MNLPIVILVIVISFFTLKNVTKLTHPKIDILSIILLSIGFGGLLYGFSNAGSNGWNSFEVIMTLILGVTALSMFIWRRLTAEKPMLEFRVLRNKIYSLTVLIGMISMTEFELLLSLYVQTACGYTPIESRMLLLPGAIVMGIMSPITGKILIRLVHDR